jgi:formylglycine-generating enzyme required for sulfatase activity
MTYTVPPDLFPRARQILLPLVATQVEREALLTEAFYLLDPLLYGISRKGSPKVFAVNCLKKLLDYGCLSKGEHSLARLLLTARYDYGAEKHAEIDALISIANALCQSAVPAPKPAAIAVPAAGPAPVQTIATPRDERRPTVFISYYHGDADFANQLIADLSAAGHACWIDTSAIKGGDEWVLTIAEGIINSYALVVVVTFEALQSRWVQKEILWAQQKKKRIVQGLPDFDLVEVPGGEFQYGDEDTKYAAKLETLTLPTFHISRYPVTCAQFQAFLDDPEGYADPRWFDGLAAADDDRPMGEQYFTFANHPRDTVNWYQAMAFCRWFSWRCDSTYDLTKVEEWAVRLPTEYEWQKAARGASGQEGGRVYPYEGDFDATKCNTHETGLGQTSAVGIFPNGASPYGVMDMSGNVWEWCLSTYDKPELEARKEDLRTENSRVLRGGSWSYLQGYARAVSRDYFHPADRFNVIGFRVVVVGRPPSL